MTNLSWFERLNHRKKYIGRFDGCTVTFWTDYDGGIILRNIGTEEFRALMRIIMKSGDYEYKFRDIDVIFKCKRLDKMVKDVMEGKIKLSEAKIGYVLHSEVKENKNKIYLLLAEIGGRAFTDALIKIKVESKSPEYSAQISQGILKSGKENFFKTLEGTLAHEFVHLWQTKASNALRIRDKNLERLVKFSGGEEKEREDLLILKGLQVFKKKNFRNIKRILMALYIMLRKEIVFLKYMLCTEGIAEFARFYLTGDLNYHAIGRRGMISAKILRKRYDMLIKNFERLVDTLNQLSTKYSDVAGYIPTGQYKKAADIMVKKLGPAAGSKEKIAAELYKLNNDYHDSISKINFVFTSQRLTNLTYRIGPMIAAVLFKYGGMDLREIGALKPSKFIKIYEDLCVKNSFPIAVAVRLKTGSVFNLTKEKIRLNALRKKLGIMPL